MIAICSTRIAALAIVSLALTAVATNEQRRPRNEAPPVGIDPNLDPPPAVAALIRRSCADCHSSATRWPWYGRIPPGSWMIQSEVTRARGALDFSNWQSKNGRSRGIAIATFAAACADVKSGRMPRPQYLFLHPDARMQAQEVARFCSWTQSETARLSTPGR